jgi:hypothetical protein
VLENTVILHLDIAARTEKAKFFENFAHAPVQVFWLGSDVALLLGALPVHLGVDAVLAEESVAGTALAGPGHDNKFAQSALEVIDRAFHPRLFAYVPLFRLQHFC